MTVLTDLQIATELVASLLDGEGVTVDRFGHNPTEGYVVGVEGHEMGAASEVSIPELAKWVGTFAGTPYYFGSWRDAETGRVYFDAVEVHEDLQEALRFAYDREEIAIWDLANNAEIRVEYNGTTKPQTVVVEHTSIGPEYCVMIVDADVSDDVDPDWPNEYRECF